MTTDKRLNVFPTRMNLNLIKENLKKTTQGYKLLKRKADAISMHHRNLKKQFDSVSVDLKEDIFDANIALAEAEYYCSDVRTFLFECSKIPICIETEVTQVVGIVLISYKLKNKTSNEITSLSKGGVSLMEARNKFTILLEKIIRLASVKSSSLKLDEIYKSTMRRVNALQYLIIPKMINTIKYIDSELDEQEREAFFVMKKIKIMKNKEKDDE